MTNAWTDEYPTSNARVVKDGLVMWETVRPSANCVYLKSQTRRLPLTFKIRLGRNVMHFLETRVPHVEILRGWTDVIYIRRRSHLRSSWSSARTANVFLYDRGPHEDFGAYFWC